MHSAGRFVAEVVRGQLAVRLTAELYGVQAAHVVVAWVMVADSVPYETWSCICVRPWSRNEWWTMLSTPTLSSTQAAERVVGALVPSRRLPDGASISPTFPAVVVGHVTLRLQRRAPSHSHGDRARARNRRCRRR